MKRLWVILPLLLLSFCSKGKQSGGVPENVPMQQILAQAEKNNKLVLLNIFAVW